MAISQLKINEGSLIIIYSVEIGGELTEEIISLVMSTLSISKKNSILSRDLAMKVLDQVEMFDQMIERASDSYRLERVSKVDKNIIYLALFDIFENKNPIGSSIHEAVRLSKKFSVPSAGRFVHAIIDAICKDTANAFAV